MRSLRTRITLLTVSAIIVAVSIVTFASVVFILKNEHHESDHLLLLLCETGERNLDFYFNSVEHSVDNVAAFVQKDLDGLDSDSLARHIDRVERYFERIAYNTNGVLTYYYRISPDVSDTVKGFWYVNLDGSGFEHHAETDISQYNTEDTTHLVWFTMPKSRGESIWLPPYITDNLGARVISYNVPIYWKQQFVGVVGIEIDYSTMAKQVESIHLYKTGYAFLNDAQGNVFYHPEIDVALLDKGELPEPPEGLLSDSTFTRYTYRGMEKQAAWLPLSNGMRLTVTVPVHETNGEWQHLVIVILLVSLAVLVTLSLFSMYYTRRITEPLEALTRAAAEVQKGNYALNLAYDRDDEVGRLTHTFRLLVDSVQNSFNDLKERVYVDALTAVKNKGAFTATVDKLQAQLDGGEETPAFAVGVFDCDDLKLVNDKYGHDRGDAYLKNACRLICNVFHHSPVFRIGGDEFAVILQNEDYDQREELARRFEREMETLCASTLNRWEQVHIAMGITTYDPDVDASVFETVRRADSIMYANKQRRKEGQ